MQLGDWTATPFFTEAVSIDKYKFNRPSHRHKLFGIFTTGPAHICPGNLDLYWLGADNIGATFNGTSGREERHTLGARYWGKIPQTNFDFEAEGAGQVVEGEAGIPFHIVHSDPDHLAYLVGLIVLQGWTGGIDELGIPTAERRTVLVVTEKPGRFREAYLRLQLPTARIEDLSVKRRIKFYQKSGITFGLGFLIFFMPKIFQLKQ